MMYVHYPQLLHQVEDLLFEGGIDITHETVWFWWTASGQCSPQKSANGAFNGVQHYLWRKVDHEGEIIEIFAPKRRNSKKVLKFLPHAMKRYGSPKIIVTDRLASYGAALKVLRQRCGRWLNNRAENSHQPFRRREGAMARFRDIKNLQKFASSHAAIHNHFNHERHLVSRDIYKQNRCAALAEWRQLVA